MSASKASKFRSRLSINPDELPAPGPRSDVSVDAPGSAPKQALSAEAEQVEQPTLAVAATSSELQPATPVKSMGKERINALDDPTIVTGRRDYRSFYVEDSAFARFRAAIYWLSRREDAADDVPENMSVAIENFMTITAEDLEKRYNDGRLFRMPPGTRRGRSSTKS